MIQIITGDDEKQIKKYLKEITTDIIKNISVLKDKHASKLIKQVEKLVKKHGNTNYYHYVLTYNPMIIRAIDVYVYKHKCLPLEIKFFTKNSCETIVSRHDHGDMEGIYRNLIIPTDVLYYGA